MFDGVWVKNHVNSLQRSVKARGEKMGLEIQSGRFLFQ